VRAGGAADPASLQEIEASGLRVKMAAASGAGEDRGPVFLHADERPAVRLRPVEGVLGAGGIGELANRVEVSVVAVVVLNDRLVQPPVVALDRRPVGLPLRQGRVLAGPLFTLAR
jgi:hypothetical protein